MIAEAIAALALGNPIVSAVGDERPGWPVIFHMECDATPATREVFVNSAATEAKWNVALSNERDCDLGEREAHDQLVARQNVVDRIDGLSLGLTKVHLTVPGKPVGGGLTEVADDDLERQVPIFVFVNSDLVDPDVGPHLAHVGQTGLDQRRRDEHRPEAGQPSSGGRSVGGLLLRYQIESFVFVGLGFAFLGVLGLVLGLNDGDWKRRAAFCAGGTGCLALTSGFYWLAINGGWSG